MFGWLLSAQGESDTEPRRWGCSREKRLLPRPTASVTFLGSVQRNILSSWHLKKDMLTVLPWLIYPLYKTPLPTYVPSFEIYTIFLWRDAPVHLLSIVESGEMRLTLLLSAGVNIYHLASLWSLNINNLQGSPVSGSPWCCLMWREGGDSLWSNALFAINNKSFSPNNQG